MREQLALGMFAFRKSLAEALHGRKGNYAVSLACRQYIQLLQDRQLCMVQIEIWLVT